MNVLSHKETEEMVSFSQLGSSGSWSFQHRAIFTTPNDVDYTSSFFFLQNHCRREDLGREANGAKYFSIPRPHFFSVSYFKHSDHPRLVERAPNQLTVSESHCDHLRKQANALVSSCLQYLKNELKEGYDIKKITNCVSNIIETNSQDYFFPVVLALRLIDQIVTGYQSSRTSENQPSSLDGSVVDDDALNPSHENLRFRLEDLSEVESVSCRAKFGDSGVGDIFNSASDHGLQIRSWESPIGSVKADFGIEDFYLDDDEINNSAELFGPKYNNYSRNIVIRDTRQRKKLAWLDESIQCRAFIPPVELVCDSDRNLVSAVDDGVDLAHVESFSDIASAPDVTFQDWNTSRSSLKICNAGGVFGKFASVLWTVSAWWMEYNSGTNDIFL